MSHPPSITLHTLRFHLMNMPASGHYLTFTVDNRVVLKTTPVPEKDRERLKALADVMVRAAVNYLVTKAEAVNGG